MRMRCIFVCGCLALLYFSTLSHKRYDVRKKYIEHEMCFLIFSRRFARNIYHFKNNSARYDRKCIIIFMWSTRYSCQILMKLELSRQMFGKYSNLKFHENPFSGSRVFPRGRTNRWTDMTKLIVTHRNFSDAPKKCQPKGNNLLKRETANPPKTAVRVYQSGCVRSQTSVIFIRWS